MKKILFLSIAVTFFFTAQATIPNTAWVTALCNVGDTLWVSAYSTGLVKYSKTTGKSTLYTASNAGLPSNNIICLATDNKRNLWLGTYRNGIGCLINDSCKIFDRYSGVGDQYCRGIYVDSNDTVFFGSICKLNILKNNHPGFIIMGQPELSKSQYINEIIPSNDGGLILATNFGLYKYSNRKVAIIDGFTMDCRSVKYDNSGNLWIATASNGLYKYSNGTMQVFNSANSQLPNSFSDMKIDKNGVFWLATGTGLIKFTGTECVNYQTENIDEITCIAIEDTCIWAGTWKNGLYCFNNGVFHKKNFIESNQTGLNSLKPDDSGWCVYPTRVKSNLFIQTPKNNLQAFSLSVFDCMGRKVFGFHLNNKETSSFDVNFLSKGLYLIELKSGNNRLFRKIIKE